LSNYTKSTNFATKDNLSPGDPLKIVRGTEIDTEFNNISTAISTKTDNSAAAITGGSISGITDLAVADGGTGASTATAALNNLLPSQSGNSSKYLQTDGTNATWDAISINTGDITGTLAVANGGTGITSFGTGIATFLGTPSSANLASAVTDETGSGALVFANTPTLVAPILGTPTSGNFSSGSFTWPTFNQNTTGTAAGLSATLAIASGGTGQTTANAAFNALAPSQTSASGKYLKSDGTNTSWDALDISTADITGTLPVANGGTGVTSSTGTGNVVLSNSPTLVTPILGTPQSGNFSTGTFTWPTFNQNTTGTAAGLSATLATTSGGTGLSSFTSGGVVYASSSSALATGSALTFDGTNTLKLRNVLTFDRYGDNTEGLTIAVNTGNSIYNSFGGLNHVWQLVGTEAMRLTSSSLYTASGINVGIGTSNPTSGLSSTQAVLEIANGNVAALSLNNTAAKKFSIYSTVSSSLVFYDITAGASRITLDTAGNLSLNNSAPSAWASDWKVMQIGSRSAFSQYNGNASAFVANNVYFAGTSGSSPTYINTAAASAYQQVNGSHVWFNAASGTAGTAVSLIQPMTLDASGNLALGKTSAGYRFDLQGAAGENQTLAGFFSGTNTSRGLTIGLSAGGTGVNDAFAVYNATITGGYAGHIWQAGGTERARIDSSGNLLVGATSSGNSIVKKSVTENAGEGVFTISSQTGFNVIVLGTTGTGYSVANTTMFVKKDTGTDRSINAAGTINASGADYAEYMTKAGDFTITKGDVVGINTQGKLTNVFADAVSFMVKSTDPSYVGGDSWGSEEAIGLTKPDADTHQEDKDAFNAALETARQRVDRIAFAGQVPVNVLGATAGQYIIPVNDNGAIKGQAVSSPTFEQYQSSVGKVIAIESDGRARIIVKVA
jgi:hypothetical protein